MSKLVKATIVERVVEVNQELPRKVCVIAVEQFIEIMIESLVNGVSIRIPRAGKLVPYFKKGGRPVRNIKTQEVMPMQDRIVVSFSLSTTKTDRNGTFIPRKNPSEMMQELAERPVLLERLERSTRGRLSPEEMKKLTRTLAEDVVRLFGELFCEYRNQCLPVEIRGLGSFRTSKMNYKSVRNPKTGEMLDVTDNNQPLRTVFREGRELKKALAERLAESA
ncbi:hypothetical protein JCM19235_1279 [Vibrio maritimus]|uniref:Uncharacterized protein n=1 Tax=Vibrio maritimus TaxID=990268 RepID=A0A090S889_9VIBR|nr:hypothetical protein JCM19235_1279 [Vibrio maritimus]